jgi:hypothetical protein
MTPDSRQAGVRLTSARARRETAAVRGESAAKRSRRPAYTIDHASANIRNTCFRTQSFGDPDCCGLFFPVERGDQADLTYNECGFVLRTRATRRSAPLAG